MQTQQEGSGLLTRMAILKSVLEHNFKSTRTNKRKWHELNRLFNGHDLDQEAKHESVISSSDDDDDHAHDLSPEKKNVEEEKGLMKSCLCIAVVIS